MRATYNDRFIDRYSRWAPNMTRANVIADYFYTPLDQQDEMRLMEGDFFNGAVRPDQMGYMRPFPEASNYRTEIESLYLCGPCTHPGGGASGGGASSGGASGKSADRGNSPPAGAAGTPGTGTPSADKAPETRGKAANRRKRNRRKRRRKRRR